MRGERCESWDLDGKLGRKVSRRDWVRGRVGEGTVGGKEREGVSWKYRVRV